MFVGDKNENINFKNMACQCDDAIPGSFARAVGNLGTSLSNRAHRENFRHMPPFSYPEPFLRAVRRGALAKSKTGNHKNMVKDIYVIRTITFVVANQMPV